MRFTKTLLTTALFGASVFSFQSTAWADTPEQQFQQGFEATKGAIIKLPLNFGYLWLSRGMQMLNLIWAICMITEKASNKIILKR